MKKTVIRCLALLLFSTSGFAQSVKQSGNVTPGHVARWITTGILGDGGTAQNGSLTSIGVTNNGGPGICVNSAPVIGPYNQTCISTKTNSGTTISSYAYGGATNPGISFDINGTLQGFVTTTLPVVNNDGACFDGTSGSIKSCGGPPFNTLTANHILVGTASNFAGDVAMIGDCTIVTAGTITCTKTSGSAFGTFATQNYATPPIIGGSTPAAAHFTTLEATGLVTANAGINVASGQTYQLGATQIIGAGSGTNTAILGAATSSANSNIILSDGQGNVRAHHDGTNWLFSGQLLTDGNTIEIGSSQVRMYTPADGVLSLRNIANTSFGRINFGGDDSNYPAIKRNAAALNFRVADDSADAAITAGQGTFTGTLFTQAISGTSVTGSGNVDAGATARLGIADRLQIFAPSDGVMHVENSAGADAAIMALTLGLTSYVEGTEQTAPAAPAANGYRIFAQDNGVGKTQLMVIFASGAAQQIAIEP